MPESVNPKWLEAGDDEEAGTVRRNEPQVRPAASVEMQRPEAPGQREAEHMQRYQPAPWNVRNGPPQRSGETQRDQGPPPDMELDENNRDVTPPDAVAMRKAQYELSIMRARNAVDQRAIPAAAWARQNIPGMETLNHALTYRERIPETRQPIQMEREFSDEESKQRYIEHVRKAMDNAKK